MQQFNDPRLMTTEKPPQLTVSGMSKAILDIEDALDSLEKRICGLGETLSPVLVPEKPEVCNSVGQCDAPKPIHSNRTEQLQVIVRRIHLAYDRLADFQNRVEV